MSRLHMGIFNDYDGGLAYAEPLLQGKFPVEGGVLVKFPLLVYDVGQEFVCEGRVNSVPAPVPEPEHPDKWVSEIVHIRMQRYELY